MATSRTSVTFRIDEAKRSAIDAIAEKMDRDRSYILNQAVDYLLDLYAWQEAHIRNGQEQAQRGEFVSETEWRRAFDRHRTA